MFVNIYFEFVIYFLQIRGQKDFKMDDIRDLTYVCTAANYICALSLH